jgi:hypothetical protein
VDDVQQFVEQWIIRDRERVTVGPNSRGLSPRERRSWWEFCLGMDEFLGNLMKNVVSRELGHQLSRLRWIALRGTYLFSTPDPALRGEQLRYVELCVIMGAAFAAIVDDAEGIRDTLSDAFGPDRFWPNGDAKWPAQVKALCGENWLRRWKNWEHARSPIAWARSRACEIHDREELHGGFIHETDALYRTPENKRDHSEASLAFDYQEKAREVLPLEEVSEFPAVAGESLLPQSTYMTVDQLRAAVREDEQLRLYMELRIKGYKPRAAWEHLGWEARYGRAIDRRFRRLRQKLKATGFEHQAREIELTPGLSDASCTVVKERLRFAVHPSSEGTLSGRVVYNPRLGVERFEAKPLKRPEK